MAVMKTAVQMVVDDRRQYESDMTATQALEAVLTEVKLHHIHTHDPIGRAYAAVLRHPKQARFDAKEIERHEHRTKQAHHHGV